MDRRVAVVGLGLGAVGCLGIALAGFFALLFLLLPVIRMWSGVGHVIKGSNAYVGSVFSQGGTPSWDQSAVTAVTNTWLHDETRAVNYDCARAHGRPCVSVPFVQAIMMQESHGDPYATSDAGALGLMQVEPSHFTAAENPLEPYRNLLVGVGFLDELDAIFQGNLPLVAAGYNAGAGTPEQWEAEFGTANWTLLATEPVVQTFSGGQTFAYVDYVMQYYAAFQPPSKTKPLTGSYLPKHR